MLLGIAIAGLDHAGLILRRIIRGNGTSKGNSTGSNHG